MRAIVVAVGGVCAVVAGLVAVFTLGLRRKDPRVLAVIRRANRTVFNPRQHDAGRPGAYASLIRHTGRRSGAEYETPVVAVATDDGFAIALPYGTDADWLANVLANRSATIVREGESHAVGDPEIVALETVDAFFSPGDQRAHRIFGTDQCLRLRPVDEQATTEASHA